MIAEGPPGGLRRVAAELRVPHPERTRIIRELASDLEDLARALEERGWAPAEARRRAEAVLLPSGASLDALERVHRPLYQRLADTVPASRVRRCERIALFGVSAFALGTALAALARVDLLASPSPFLVPVLALGTASVAAGLAKAFQLFVKREHGPGRLGAGLGAVAWLGGATLAAAAAGAVTDLYTLAARMEAGPGDPGGLILRFIRRDATLLACGLTLALAAGLLWLLLRHWVAAVESAEDELAVAWLSSTPTMENLP